MILPLADKRLVEKSFVMFGKPYIPLIFIKTIVK
jgi:hypothetical protein